MTRSAAPLFLAVALAACTGEAGPEAAAVPLLVDGGTVVVMDDAGTVLEGGAVLVEDSRIARLLAADEPRPSGVQVLDATGHLVVPGMVNVHGHAAMSLLRGLADDLPLMTWLEEHIFPVEAQLVAPEFVYWGTLLSSVEMLRGGTTTFADMYYFPDDVARAVAAAGIRAVTGPGIIGFPAPDFETPDASLESAPAYFERWSGHPLITLGVSAHALYTTPLDAVERAVRLANERGAVFQIHAAEDASEDSVARAATGMGVVEALESVGALRPGTVLAHAVYLSDADIARVAASGAGSAAIPVHHEQSPGQVDPAEPQRHEVVSPCRTRRHGAHARRQERRPHDGNRRNRPKSRGRQSAAVDQQPRRRQQVRGAAGVQREGQHAARKDRRPQPQHEPPAGPTRQRLSRSAGLDRDRPGPHHERQRRAREPSRQPSSRTGLGVGHRGRAHRDRADGHPAPARHRREPRRAVHGPPNVGQVARGLAVNRAHVGGVGHAALSCV